MMIVVIAATNMSSENRIMNAPTINKIEFVYRTARFGLLLALGVLTLTTLFTTAAPVKTDEHSNPNAVAADTASLKPPDNGQIPVAFLISDGAVVIDFCGPWEVFQDAMIPSSREMPFRLYTVAETKKPAEDLRIVRPSLTHRRPRHLMGACARLAKTARPRSQAHEHTVPCSRWSPSSSRSWALSRPGLTA